MSEKGVDREELLQRVAEVRSVACERLCIPALRLMPTKACDRVIATSLDSLYDLEALLRKS